MYHKFLCNCFLKFIVHEMNSKIINSRMVVLTKKEKTDVVDANVFVGWMM
jgi:hypothetical protein